MFQTEESVGETIMVTNAELAKEMGKKKERNRILEEALEEMKTKLEEVDEVTKTKDKEGESSDSGKEKIDEEDIIPEPDPPLNEEPFLKAIKALVGKTLEQIPLFSGKMETETVMEWIEGMENHFDCECVIEAQKVKVAKSRLRVSSLTYWKYMQDERVRMGRKPIANWNAMVTKVKENYLPEDYEVQLHRKRQGLKQKDLDVASYTEEFQNLCLRSC